MRLTVRQQKLIDELQLPYIQAAQQWGQNPSEFDANIHFFAELERIDRALLHIFKYELRAVRHGELEFDGVFQLILLGFERLKSEAVMAAFMAELCKEPRIADVRSDARLEWDQISMFKAREIKFDYTIQFSNGAQIKFSSLTNEKVLDEIRCKFEREMYELAMHDTKRQKLSA